MLRISRLTDYAVVMMTQIARSPPKTWLTVNQLAQVTGVPLPTAAKVMKILVNAGFITSQRGVYGGYALLREAHSISVAEIITAFEGPITLTACISSAESHCEIESLCPIRGQWDTVNEAIQQVLEDISLCDLIASKKDLSSIHRLDPLTQDHSQNKQE